MECIFCDILAGKAKVNIIYEDERCVAFPDLHPLVPLHFLIIPREHISSIADAQGEEIVSHLVYVANRLAQTEGISSRGYRLVINCGPEGGQVVPHLHLHLLGGQRLEDRLG